MGKHDQGLVTLKQSVRKQKKVYFRNRWIFVFLFTIIIFGAACVGRSGEEKSSAVESADAADAGEPDLAGEPVNLTIAMFEENGELRRQVEAFRQSHPAWKIEIQTYTRSDQPEEDGIARLQREVMAGKGPDIIDFGGGFSISDIAGCYTEDLMAYLAREGMEDYFENILSVFRYKDGLYAAPTGFALHSFAGTAENLGGLEHWNIAEMMECYERQRADRILVPGETKKQVLGWILSGNINYYIDWETGTCAFDGQEFQDMLAFCNLFPDTLKMAEDYSVKQIFADNKALLMPVLIEDVYQICEEEYIFEEKSITYIGFPVEGESGTVVTPGRSVLAISKSSKQKERAWEFIAWCLGEEGQSQLKWGLPVRKSVFEAQLQNALEAEYEIDSEGNRKPVVKNQILFEGEEPVEIYAISEAQAEKLRELIASAEMHNALDDRLYRILLEEADYYFNGDKTLEETARVIQGRAQMYVSERVK